MNIHPQAHNTPVYNIQWNTFIPNIFITCASGAAPFATMMRMMRLSRILLMIIAMVMMLATRLKIPIKHLDIGDGERSLSNHHGCHF